MKLILLFFFIFVEKLMLKCENVSNYNDDSFTNIINDEKLLTDKIKFKLAKNSHILSNLDKFISLKSENKVCGESSCFFLEKEKSNQKKNLYNKKMVMKEIIFDNFNEKIINFHVFSMVKNHYDKHIHKREINKYLILFFTSTSLFVSNPKGKILTKETFSYNFTRVDFSTFDDGFINLILDNLVAVLTNKSELIILNIDLKINDTLQHQQNISNEDLSVEIHIPAQKSKTINLKDDEIINFHQNRLMSNKYIIIGLRKGNVLYFHFENRVFTRELELRASFVFPNSINNIYVHQGILGVFVNKQLIFVNMLGGNQVVVSCYNYFSMIEAVYDGLNNFLLAVDYTGNLLIFSAKISLSKQTSNECNQIYKYKIRNFKSYAKLKLYRQNLYIFTDSGYVSIIDLKYISENGIFFVNEYFISHKNINSTDYKDNAFDNRIIEGNFLGFEKSNYLFLKCDFLQNTNALITIKISNNKKVVKMIENNFIDGNDIISLPTSNNSQSEGWSSIGLYFFAIVAISLIVFYFKRKSATNKKNEKLGLSKIKKNYNEEEDTKGLEEMFAKLKSIENVTKNLKNKNSNKKFEKINKEEEKIDDELSD